MQNLALNFITDNRCQKILLINYQMLNKTSCMVDKVDFYLILAVRVQ